MTTAMSTGLGTFFRNGNNNNHTSLKPTSFGKRRQVFLEARKSTRGPTTIDNSKNNAWSQDGKALVEISLDQQSFKVPVYIAKV